MLIFSLTWLNDFPCPRDLCYEGTAVLHFIHNLLVVVALQLNSKGSLVNLGKFNNDMCQFMFLTYQYYLIVPTHS